MSGLTHAAVAVRGVPQVVESSAPYPLASRAANPRGTVVCVNGLAIGGAELVVVGEPCCVRDEKHAFDIAAVVCGAGASVLQAAAPRSAARAQAGATGNDQRGWLREAATAHGLNVMCEVGDVSEIDSAKRCADILQVGARSMQNFTLLRALGRTATPVLLTRGGGATIEEWLLAAEYLLCGGNADVILCDGGIRTFDGGGNNTLDIAAIPLVKGLSHLPVVVDTTRATSCHGCVAPIARASVAAGAAGVTVRIGTGRHHAGCDARTALTHSELAELIPDLQAINRAGRPARVAAADDRSARQANVGYENGM